MAIKTESDKLKKMNGFGVKSICFVKQQTHDPPNTVVSTLFLFASSPS